MLAGIGMVEVIEILSSDGEQEENWQDAESGFENVEVIEDASPSLLRRNQSSQPSV